MSAHSGVLGESSTDTASVCRFWLGFCGGYPGATRFFEPDHSGAGNCGRQCRNTYRWSHRVRRRRVDEPLRSGRTGWALLAAEALAGPISLFLRIWWASDPIGRKAAAARFLAGALTIRYAWLAAGLSPRAISKPCLRSNPNSQKFNLSLQTQTLSRWWFSPTGVKSHGASRLAKSSASPLAQPP
jgi:hypothetical protein